MKSIFNFFTYLIVFVLFLIVFIPKESFYNLAEIELEKQNIIVSNEKREESAFSFKLKDANIFYEGIKIANINKSKITSYILYSKAEISNVNLLESLSTLFPTPIEEILIKHSIFNYDKLSIESIGKFGKADGYIDIVNRILYLSIEISPQMKSNYTQVLKNMKQKDGRYVYEYKF